MNPTRSESITVLGAGSWGTALALLLAANGLHVTLWGRNEAAMKSMAQARENTRYLPDVSFPANLVPTCDFTAAVRGRDAFLVVVPSHAFPEILRGIATHAADSISVVWGTKGLAPDSGRLLHEVAGEILGAAATLGVISGPSFAREVARGQPAALTLAAASIDRAEQMSAWFRSDTVRIYPSDDIAGVQLGGAIKNVMAIATGISDGLELGANSRAALITRGLAEMNRLGRALGGRIETFMGLTGVGDLILTCTDDQSRNRRVGLGIGRGYPLDQVLADIGQEAEGVSATREVLRRARQLGVEMPITQQVYRVLFEGCDPQDAVRALLTREPARE